MRQENRLDGIHYKCNLQRFYDMICQVNTPFAVRASESFSKYTHERTTKRWKQESLIIALEWLSQDNTDAGKALYRIGHALLMTGKLAHERTTLDTASAEAHATATEGSR